MPFIRCGGCEVVYDSGRFTDIDLDPFCERLFTAAAKLRTWTSPE